MATEPKDVVLPEFITTKELAKMTGCGYSTACKLIHKWNGELSKKGYDTIRGRVSLKYAKERLALC